MSLLDLLHSDIMFCRESSIKKLMVKKYQDVPSLIRAYSTSFYEANKSRNFASVRTSGFIMCPKRKTKMF